MKTIVLWACYSTLAVFYRCFVESQLTGLYFGKATKKMSISSENNQLSKAVNEILDKINKLVPPGRCKDQFSKDQLKTIIRFTVLQKWPLIGILRLLDSKYKCTKEILIKIVKYASWTWWETFIEHCDEDIVTYKEMSELCEFPFDKQFIINFYFRYVDAFDKRCDVNQILALLWYKKLAVSYHSPLIIKDHIIWLIEGICGVTKRHGAFYNSRVLLKKKAVLESHPVYLVNLYQHCSPRISYPWTIPLILSYLKNCTKFNSSDCSKNYCRIIGIASWIGCEPEPCFKNALAMSSKYQLTLTELVYVFEHLIRMKVKRGDSINLFYDNFEKSIISNLLSHNPKKMYKVCNMNTKLPKTNLNHPIGNLIYFKPKKNLPVFINCSDYNNIVPELGMFQIPDVDMKRYEVFKQECYYPDTANVTSHA